MRSLLCKLIQKKTYDVLSKKYTITLLFIGFVVIVVAMLHFGETMMEWSKEKYSTVFSSFSNNIGGRSFQNMLCQHLPIDVVYTWVNGTDPKHLWGLTDTKEKYGFTQRRAKVRQNASEGVAFCILTFDEACNKIEGCNCVLSICLEWNMVFIKPELSKLLTLSDLEEADPSFEEVTDVFTIATPYTSHNVTVLVFPNIEKAKNAAAQKSLILDSTTYEVSLAFVTDNWLLTNTITLKDTFMVPNVVPNSTEKLVKEMFPKDIRKVIRKVVNFKDKGIAVLTVNNTDIMTEYMKMLETAKNRKMSLFSANLVVELPNDHEDVAASRFIDNEELRYSLRSLEKHAPWVQHIYIVTSGQIPYWLNLDNPRLTIITHEDIFPNVSHLPTFSSPAIECHLHRIPGLSKKYLYLNDDVMFGKDVWPEDFYTHTKGQKVYLSWPVPNCADGCPSSWIRDGYCDKPCNNSQCQWDGGDCTMDNPLLPHHPMVVHQENSVLNLFRGAASFKNYCNEECADTWLADRYCDKACNTIICGYDAGDCGIDHFHKLPQLILAESVNEYELTAGKTAGFLNLTQFISDDRTITESFYDDNAVIRTLALSLKHSILSIILYPGYNATRLMITLKGKKGEQPFEKKIYIKISPSTETEMCGLNETASEEPIVFENFPETLRSPKVLMLVTTTPKLYPFSNVNISASDLSNDTINQVNELKELFDNGEITEKGYYIQKSKVIEEYVNDYKAKHNSSPEFIYEKPISIENSTIAEKLTASTLPSRLSQLFKGNEVSKNDSIVQPSHTSSSMPLLRHFSQNLASLKFEDNSVTKYLLNRSTENKITFTYETPTIMKRQLLDTFSDSLRHVNKLYNEAFGYEARKVPSHIAHFVDKDIMSRLYDKFSHAFNVTSSHKIRSPNDMQFAFSYYYYLMSEMETVSIDDIFNVFDIDKSGTWSDREIRIMLAQLHDLPLDFASVNTFEQNIINCTFNFYYQETSFPTPFYERYYGSKLPTVTKTLIKMCAPITDMLNRQFGQRKRNKFELLGEEEVAFKMIHNNVSHVMNQIDDIRKTPRKFICLNDNMHHWSREAETIKAVILDFYESLFPSKSQFELPHDYRNRFLYVEQLKAWRETRDLIRIATYMCLALLIIFSIVSFVMSEVKPRNHRHLHRRSRSSRSRNKNPSVV